jgi:hypothetical protein
VDGDAYEEVMISKKKQMATMPWERDRRWIQTGMAAKPVCSLFKET